MKIMKDAKKQATPRSKQRSEAPPRKPFVVPELRCEADLVSGTAERSFTFTAGVHCSPARAEDSTRRGREKRAFAATSFRLCTLAAYNPLAPHKPYGRPPLCMRGGRFV